MDGKTFGQLRAFPITGAQGQGGNGMTIRMWLAGMAMQGLTSARAWPDDPTSLAQDALANADALCELLAKEQSE